MPAALPRSLVGTSGCSTAPSGEWVYDESVRRGANVLVLVIRYGCALPSLLHGADILARAPLPRNDSQTARNIWRSRSADIVAQHATSVVIPCASNTSRSQMHPETPAEAWRACCFVRRESTADRVELALSSGRSGVAERLVTSGSLVPSRCPCSFTAHRCSQFRTTVERWGVGSLQRPAVLEGSFGVASVSIRARWDGTLDCHDTLPAHCHRHLPVRWLYPSLCGIRGRRWSVRRALRDGGLVVM